MFLCPDDDEDDDAGTDIDDVRVRVDELKFVPITTQFCPTKRPCLSKN